MSIDPSVSTVVSSLATRDSLDPSVYSTTSSVRKSERKSKKKQKRVSSEPEIAPVHRSAYEIPGVSRLVLSTVSQKVIGCLIGDDVTAENPWVYVKKERIQDNLDLHEHSSEFISIRDEIKHYPETEIFVGWIPGASNTEDHFFVVHSLEAKRIVLRLIEQESIMMKRKLESALVKYTRKWHTYGSEREVEEGMIRNLRPLYEVQIEADIGARRQNSVLQMRKAEDVRDGYVELLPDPRYPLEVIEKKRVDAMVQVTPRKITTYCQTEITSGNAMNATTQCDSRFLEIPRDAPIDTKKQFGRAPKKVVIPVFKTNYMTSSIEEITEFLSENVHMPMYDDDYRSLPHDKRLRINSSVKLHTIATFSDAVLCRNMQVTSTSWDKFNSGILVIAYSDFAVNEIIQQRSKTDEVLRTVYGYYPALVWSYARPTYPQLFLEASRQITCVSFCPYKKDIVVGGCINGQVLIWELADRLTIIENPKILSHRQQKVHLNMMLLMWWMKNVENISAVQPSLVTSLKNSQTEAITSINWLPPGLIFNRKGKISTTDVNEVHKQFITTSMDGTCCFWDMDDEEQQARSEMELQAKQQTTSKKKKKPEQIVEQMTDIMALGENFKPIYKLFLTTESRAFPITTILKYGTPVVYKPVSFIDTDPRIRTQYELAEVSGPSELPGLFFASTIGKIAEAKWTGCDIGRSKEIITEIPNLDMYESIHDGPIVKCSTNQVVNSVVLTIGGRIFAIWETSVTRPLLWKRAPFHNKYLSGGWTSSHPSYFTVLRTDGICELWDLLVNNMRPTRVIVIQSAVSTHGFRTPFHCSKCTFGAAHVSGAFTVFDIPQLLLTHGPDEEDLFKSLIGRGVRRAIHLDKWISEFDVNYEIKFTVEVKVSHIRQELEKQSSLFKSVSDQCSQIKKLSEMFGESQIGSHAGMQVSVECSSGKLDVLLDMMHSSSLEEKIRFEEALALKHISLDFLEEQRSLVQRTAIKKKELAKRKSIIMHKKEKIFKNAKALLLPTRKLPKIRTFTRATPKFDDAYGFVEDYAEIEARSLAYIKDNPFIYKTSFAATMENAKKRFKIAQDILCNTKPKEKRKDTSYYQGIFDDIQNSSQNMYLGTKLSATATEIYTDTDLQTF